jgi:hypothetical protein
MTWECFYRVAYEMYKIGFSVHGVVSIGTLYSVFISQMFSSKECGRLVALSGSEVKWNALEFSLLVWMERESRQKTVQYLFIIHKYNNTYYRQNTTLGKDVVYSYMFRLTKS